MDENKYKNGFTRFPNDLLSNMYKMKLGGYAMRVLLFIFRKTHGFQKQLDYISHSQIMEATGIEQKQNVWRALKELKDRKIIIKILRKIIINPDASAWILFPKSQSSRKQLKKKSSGMITGVIKNDYKSNHNRGPQKKTIIQKKKKLDIEDLKRTTGIESLGDIIKRNY